MTYANINAHTHPQTSNANLSVDDALFFLVGVEPLSLVDVSTACVAGLARDTAPLGDGATIGKLFASLGRPVSLSRALLTAWPCLSLGSATERRNQKEDRSKHPS
jgi:hypothetical protein